MKGSLWWAGRRWTSFLIPAPSLENHVSCTPGLITNGGGRAVALLIPGRKMRSYLCTSVCWCVDTHVEYFFQEVGKPMNSRKHLFFPLASANVFWVLGEALNTWFSPFALRKSESMLPSGQDLGDPGTIGPSAQTHLPSQHRQPIPNQA